MTRRIQVVSPGVEQTLTEDEFPLPITRAAGACLRVPGPVTAELFGSIGILDDRLFLLPTPGAVSVTVNGEPAGGTRWLDDGSVVEVAGLRIVCELGDNEWMLRVAHDALEFDTLPPEQAEGATAAPTIEPVRPRAAPANVPVPSAPARRPWRYVGGGLLVLLLLFAFYLFTARAVSFDVEPADANVSVAGSLLSLQFGGRYLLRPGDYRVILSADGYESLREEVTVSQAASQSFEFALQKLPGRVVVDTRQGVDADVFIDDQPVGPTPTEAMKLAAGPHSVKVVADRYQPFESVLEVEGRDVLQTFTAELVPGWGEVSVSSVPDGAIIMVGDEELGTTPGVIELIAGTHEVLVGKDGFKTWRRPVTIAATEQISLPEAQLQQADGLLTVTTVPSAAAVTINGRYRGETPLDVELSPGASYQVLIAKPGFASVTRQVSMESREGRSLRVALEARVGSVRIVSDPPDAELLVDGKPRGQSGQTLTLPARAHQIELRKPGFEPYRVAVTPKPGLEQLVEARLMTPEQAIIAATPTTVTTSQGLTLRLIRPGGEFDMGAPRREQGRRPNETQRRVELTRPFYLGLREITNTEYREFRTKHTSGAEKYRQLAGGDHPAVMLSWNDAAEFCNWLSDKDSLPRAYRDDGNQLVLIEPRTTGYRLPTEAEWVWVARYNAGAETRKYPWGGSMPPSQGAGNFADVSARGILPNVLSSYDDGFPVTAPAGRFAASPLGFFDLGGNAAEWMNDIYSVAAVGKGVARDPAGAAEGQYHVIRGSSWRHYAISELRVAYRDFGDLGRLDVGFRIARYADDAPE